MKLIALIQRLGTQNIRARRLITLSKAYLLDPPCLSDPRPSKPVIYSPCCRPVRSGRTYPPTPISHLPGAGSYALDSYRIFCSPSEEWKMVMPDDKELIRYLVLTTIHEDIAFDLTILAQKWKWAFEEQKEWIPKLGAVRPANLSYLELLITELAENLR
jgi:methyl-CpG-binding domain protein 4